MSFDPQEILASLYQNPPEMYKVKKASITKSSFSPPGITPKRQYHESAVLEIMEPPVFNKDSIPVKRSETADFPIVNMNKRKSCIPNRNHVIGTPHLEATKFQSTASLYQLEEDKYFPYSRTHLNALFDDYNLTINQQQLELFKITQHIQRINKLIRSNKRESDHLNKLLNRFNDLDNFSENTSEVLTETYSESNENDDLENKITTSLRQNFQNSQQLSIETEKVSDMTERIEMYQNFNEKCNHCLNSDFAKETDDIIDYLSKLVEQNDNQMNETVKSYEFKIKQKDAIIAELQERLAKIKNSDLDPNKDANTQNDQSSPSKKDLHGYPTTNNEPLILKRPEPFPQMQNTEAFPSMIRKNSTFPAGYNAEAFPSLKT